jgi:hypothetical protein
MDGIDPFVFIRAFRGQTGMGPACVDPDGSFAGLRMTDGLNTEHKEYTESRQLAQEATEGTEWRGRVSFGIRRKAVGLMQFGSLGSAEDSKAGWVWFPRLPQFPPVQNPFSVCSVCSVVINSGPWAIHLDVPIHGASGDPPSKRVAWLACGKAHRDQPSQGSVSTSVALHLRKRRVGRHALQGSFA